MNRLFGIILSIFGRKEKHSIEYFLKLNIIFPQCFNCRQKTALALTQLMKSVRNRSLIIAWIGICDAWDMALICGRPIPRRNCAKIAPSFPTTWRSTGKGLDHFMRFVPGQCRKLTERMFSSVIHKFLSRCAETRFNQPAAAWNMKIGWSVGRRRRRRRRNDRGEIKGNKVAHYFSPMGEVSESDTDRNAAMFACSLWYSHSFPWLNAEWMSIGIGFARGDSRSIEQISNLMVVAQWHWG